MPRNWNAWPPEEYDRLETLYLRGLTYQQIADQLGRSYNQVRGALSYLGLTRQGRPHPNARDDWAAIDAIIADCVECSGMCVPQIVSHLKAMGKAVSRGSILNRLDLMPEVRREALRNARKHRATKSSIYWQRERARKRAA